MVSKEEIPFQDRRTNGSSGRHVWRVCQASLLLLMFSAAACSSDSDGSAGSGGSSAGASGQGGSSGSGSVSSGGGSGGNGPGSSSSNTSGGAKAGSGGNGGSSAATSESSTSSGGSSGLAGKSGGGTTAGTTGGTGEGGTTAIGGSSATGGQAGRTGGATATGGTSDMGGSKTAGGTTATGGTTTGSSNNGGNSGAYNPCPAAGTECLVLPLGDSITEGYGASGNVGGYRMELFRLAVADNKNIKFVGSMLNGPNTLAGKTFPRNHEGHGGFTISGGNGSAGIGGDITNKAMTNYKPHIVLLMIGTNDINGNIDVAGAPTRLKTLINSIITASSTTLVVVASIIPIENTGNQKVKDYNKSVKSVADELAGTGKHVVFLDNYAAFTTDASFRSKWMSDYLHPNDTGYNVLGQSWYSVIGPLLR